MNKQEKLIKFKDLKRILMMIAIGAIFFIIGIRMSFNYLNITKRSSESRTKIDAMSTVETNEKNTIESFDLDKYIKRYHNKDIFARLEIPNLFNILLVKGQNNEFYLTHAIDLSENEKGTEFIDYRVKEDSNQINIYGHNSRTYNLPFHQLEQFNNQDFFDENKYIILETREEIRKYQIFSFKEVVNDYEHMILNKKGKEYVNHLYKIKENSLFDRKVNFQENSHILIIQTCSFNNPNSFYLLSAIELETKLIEAE